MTYMLRGVFSKSCPLGASYIARKHDLHHDKTGLFVSLFEFDGRPYYWDALVKKYQAYMYTRGV